MDYEVEFHPVGDGEKAGDAITVRYGLNGAYEIMVIDGGTADCGASVVEKIKKHYGEDAIITHMVSTHPDADHASGLREILSNFSVMNLWVHGLWTHAGEVLPYLSDKRWTEAGLAQEIKNQYPIISEIIELANAQGTQIYEPFQGAQIGPFVVLSPTAWSYARLLAQFRKTPDVDQAALEAENMYLGVRKGGVVGMFKALVEAAANWIGETWDHELLKENPKTAAENETSTILYGRFGDHSVLLTADAGVNALHWACDSAEAFGFDFSTLDLIQVPHHGSRSNVCPSILDRLIGPKLPAGTITPRIAVASVPKDNSKHPRKMVVNAFARRGVPVHKTAGVKLRHHHGAMPARAEEGLAEPYGWFDQVEAYD